jgi:transglutaminase-like putative cysteine protease
MTTQIAFQHRTDYAFPRPVTLGPHTIRLRPAPHTRTNIQSFSLEVQPAAHRLHWQQDPFGNWQARVFFLQPTEHLSVLVDVIAEMAAVDPFDFFVEPEATTWPFAYETTLREDLAPYLEAAPAGPRLEALLSAVPRAPRYTVEFLVEINRRLAKSIGYVVRLEPGIQPLEETLALGTGSCRDTGWLLVQLLRHLGIAARFVSGYLIQLAGDPAGSDGPVADVAELHAWAEAFLPGAGWIGFDPTSGLLAGEGHIPLAASPRPDHAAPIDGTAELPSGRFDYEITVERLNSRPRMPRPFLPSAWHEIERLGRALDERMPDELTVGIARRRSDGSRTDAATTWEADLVRLDSLRASAPDARYRRDGLPASTDTSPIVLEAPFAARPDLLVSLIRYWQLHPSLSYFFSGGRIGPDGAAPRVDELAGDALAELEIALRLTTAQTHRPADGLRDVLVDARGETGHAELTIDDAATSLTMAAFGIAPAPRMALLEHLLVRALAFRSSQEPCRLPLAAHGNRLHDSYLLPYWLEHDLDLVLAELRDFGLAFRREWFAAQLEHRFPFLGGVEIAGIRIELRAALEPQRLLRVRTPTEGQVRPIDDSFDRVQVLVDGKLERYQQVVCNGWVLPLAATPDACPVAGIRFRARLLPAMLHPTIPPQAHLQFDLVDMRSGRSMGGCRYIVERLEGGSYADAPVNDLTAESRRLARFEPMRHTGGVMQPRRLDRSHSLPHTLDLRDATG